MVILSKDSLARAMKFPKNLTSVSQPVRLEITDRASNKTLVFSVPSYAVQTSTWFYTINADDLDSFKEVPEAEYEYKLWSIAARPMAKMSEGILRVITNSKIQNPTYKETREYDIYNPMQQI